MREIFHRRYQGRSYDEPPAKLVGRFPNDVQPCKRWVDIFVMIPIVPVAQFVSAIDTETAIAAQAFA